MKKRSLLLVLALSLLLSLFTSCAQSGNGDGSATLSGSVSLTESVTVTDSGTETDELLPPTLDPELANRYLASKLFVYNVSEEYYLLEKGTDEKIVPASITKLLSALYALSVIPKDEIIKPGNELELVKPGSSIAYIKSHHRLTVEMLIEGMLLPSGNDASYVLAAGVARYVTNDPKMDGKAASDYFMKQVNEYARSIGCTGTNYTCPDGFEYIGHYTTAHDLIITAKKAMENEIIRKYAKTATHKVFYASGETMTWNNTNQLIRPESPYYRECVTGLKTGSLDLFSLLVTAEIDGQMFVIGVFDSPSNDERFRCAAELVDLLLDGGYKTPVTE